MCSAVIHYVPVRLPVVAGRVYISLGFNKRMPTLENWLHLSYSPVIDSALTPCNGLLAGYKALSYDAAVLHLDDCFALVLSWTMLKRSVYYTGQEPVPCFCSFSIDLNLCVAVFLPPCVCVCVYIYIYIYIYMCVCLSVCEKELWHRESQLIMNTAFGWSIRNSMFSTDFIHLYKIACVCVCAYVMVILLA